MWRIPAFQPPKAGVGEGNSKAERKSSEAFWIVKECKATNFLRLSLSGAERNPPRYRKPRSGLESKENFPETQKVSSGATKQRNRSHKPKRWWLGWKAERDLWKFMSAQSSGPGERKSLQPSKCELSSNCKKRKPIHGPIIDEIDLTTQHGSLKEESSFCLLCGVSWIKFYLLPSLLLLNLQYPAHNKKLQGTQKSKKMWPTVTYSEMIHVLELSHRDFKITMKKTLMDMVKMDNTHEEMGNFRSRL